MQAQEDRPAYVMFEVRPVEDRQASIDAGHYVAKDVDYAIITPAGSKDRIERIVDEWFPQMEEAVRGERFPVEWLRKYRENYNAWKSGQEIPLSGTHVRAWPVASPAQVQALLNLRLLTVEDLAVANEETLNRLGMGFRALRDKAVNWLASSKDTGQNTEKISALEVLVKEQAEQNARLQEQVNELMQKLASQDMPKATKL
ncbi:p50 [Bacteriophage sp.]|nr:p50 [Bacteriophage sp.]